MYSDNQLILVKRCLNKDPRYSSTISLWKNNKTNQYYVSGNEYYDPEDIMGGERNYKLVRPIDFMNGFIEYDGTHWKLIN